MKMTKALLCLALFACALPPASADAEVVRAHMNTNPVAKVIELLSNLEAKVLSQGETEQKLYDEFAEWCEDESKQKQFEIKTGKAEKEKLEATIAKATADIEDADTRIGELAEQIATADADLKAATEIRNKENADFTATEADLVETIDILQRAIGILEQEMAKHPSAFLQATGSGSPAAQLASVLKTIVDATSLSGKDKAKLTALVQTHESGEASISTDEDALDRYTSMGAPDPAAYKGHSSGIIDVMNDMLEEAEAQLADARKAETQNRHNFEMLEQSLKDEMKHANMRLDATKKAKAAAAETKAVAEGDLAECTAELNEDIEYLAKIHGECMNKATVFETAVKSRNEELKALAEAKKIISEATEGGTEVAYGAASFLQLGSESTLRTSADLANLEVVNLVKKLAETHKSAALFQLAQAIRATIRIGSRVGDDPFAKVKGLIKDMIERLLKEAADDANHKAFCDHEMAETKTKKEDLEGTIDDLNTKIDKMNADITRLKEEVATLQQELAALAKAQAEMDALRQKEHEEFLRVEKELEEGVEGLGMALKILREYYAEKGASLMQQPVGPSEHEKATGAASGIIGLLEVCEADFTKSLSDATTEEETSQADYDDQTKENAIAKTTKEQDVKYKTKEYKGLEKAVNDAQSDLATTEMEYKAVMEYWKSLKEQCIAKPEPYEERKRRREAEIAGLKEALQILEGEALALLQRHSVKHRRGFLEHRQ